MPRTKIPANVVGPQIRKLRYESGFTQEMLAARCQLAGLDISRATLAQIESRLRYVCDEELFVIASVLAVTTDELYPVTMKKQHRRKRV